MEALDKIIGGVVTTHKGVEYRQPLDKPLESSRHTTADGRHWIAVGATLPKEVLAKGFTILWMEDKKAEPGKPAEKPKINNNLYGLPDELEPFRPDVWEQIGGKRIESLTGPRLEALGRYLFTSNPQAARANRVLGRLVNDCTEASLSNYLIAIRNPHCFHKEYAKPLLDYTGWSVFDSNRYFEFYSRPGAVQVQRDKFELVKTSLETARVRFESVTFNKPSVPPRYDKIPVVFDDWGSVRGDTTPTGPIRLNARVLNLTDTSERLIHALCAHELFHRVQYSYGFRLSRPGDVAGLPFVEHRPYLYFSEGTASWSEALVFETSTANEKMQALLGHPEISLLHASYAAFIFWLAYAPVTPPNAGGPVVAEFLETYRKERDRGNRQNAIRVGLGDSTFESVIAEKMQIALRGVQLNSPDIQPQEGPTPILTDLRVTPVNVAKRVQINGAVQPYGRDVFSIRGPVEAAAAGSVMLAIERSATDTLVHVQGGSGTPGQRSLPYSLVLAPTRPANPRLTSIPPPVTKDIVPSKELKDLGIKVQLDNFGNVLLKSKLFTELALGFQVHRDIPNAPGRFYQLVLASIAGSDPMHPGEGNRDFSPGVFGRDSVALTPLNRVPAWVPGPHLESAAREVWVKGLDLVIKTTMRFTAGLAGFTFGLTSLSLTDPSVRDSDMGERATCEGGGNDCDPDTRPAVMLDVWSSGAFSAGKPVSLSPGYVLAPFTVSLGGRTAQEVSFELRYSCEKFKPLFPPCPPPR